jgi:hypothetical protein
MELETTRSFDQPAAAPAAETPMAPIPLVDVDEEFELEKPYESPTTTVGSKEMERAAPAPRPVVPPPPAAWAAAPAPAPVPAPEPEPDADEFDLEAPHEAPSTAWAATIRPLPVLEEPPPPPPAPPPPAAQASPSALISPTLGELYFNQGFTEKAIEVYRELSAREPANERLGARLRELEKLQGAIGNSAADAAPGDAPPAAAGGAGSADTTASDRREAIERTIARLEGLLSVIRKG